jgi:hypothetical protein
MPHVKKSDDAGEGTQGGPEGLRGRFADYVPPVMDRLGPAAVEHQSKNNLMRAT